MASRLLARTFLFLPGIGPAREALLWRRGVASWDAYRELARVPGVRPRMKEQHDGLLGLAERALGRDARFFARLLPTREHWRCFHAFGRDAAYVDIETTGDRENLVTVVGVRRGGRNVAFVKGLPDALATTLGAASEVAPYTPEAVSAHLAGATCLVTFNGASFDLPVLQGEGVRLPEAPHADLRLVLARAGYTGGLKKIEETLGFARADGVRGLSGWDAVKLWRKWEARQDADALRTLVDYNVADFENLEPLARFAVARLEEQTLASLTAQTRLAPEEGAPAHP